MDKHELIQFTKEFMDKTDDYSSFRHGGNLGEIIKGYLHKEAIDKLSDELSKLNKTLNNLIINYGQKTPSNKTHRSHKKDHQSSA